MLTYILTLFSIFIAHRCVCGANLFYEDDYFMPNTCKDGRFYVYGQNFSTFPAECYPSLLNFSSHEYSNPRLIPRISNTSSNLSPVYFTEYLPNHPCYTSNISEATLFIAVFWMSVWKYKADCTKQLTHVVKSSPAWENMALRGRHVIYHFWGGMVKSWYPAIISGKDCIEYDAPSIWVNAIGEPYPDNSTCHIANPECSIAGACEMSGPDRHWHSNCSFVNNCYLVVDRWSKRGMTSIYFETLDDPISNKLPIVKPINEREYLVMGAWGVKKRARSLRSQLTDALTEVKRGVFVPIHQDANKERVEMEYVKNSTFCLVPKGDSPSRRGFSTCIIHGAIPIICSDHFIPPYHNMMNWKDMYLRIPEHTCADFLIKTLPTITKEKIQFMHENLMKIRSALFFRVKVEANDGDKTIQQIAVQPGGPIDMHVRQMFLTARLAEA